MDDLQSLYISRKFRYYNFTDCVVLHVNGCYMLSESINVT